MSGRTFVCWAVGVVAAILGFGLIVGFLGGFVKLLFFILVVVLVLLVVANSTSGTKKKSLPPIPPPWPRNRPPGSK